MTYSLPFDPQQQRVLELGGGNAPLPFTINVDVRPGPHTAFTADFEKPLPIRGQDFDGVFSKFAAEHISWRTVDGFFAETWRVLKPGGRLVLVVPNLLEQMRLGVELGDSGQWDVDPGHPASGLNEMSKRIFGDHDYGENAHRVGWCPEYICRALRAAGYASVMVVPFGELGTDMIVEAVKA
jgi:SAM-dependent methyltransferase